jgi:hypothetical protein
MILVEAERMIHSALCFGRILICDSRFLYDAGYVTIAVRKTTENENPICKFAMQPSLMRWRTFRRR